MNVGRARLAKIEESYADILGALDIEFNGSTADTPRRAALALVELTAGYGIDIPALFTTFDAEEYDEMVVVKEIPFASLCEHHLLPFYGKAAVAYIPDGRIVGLSKIARLVDAFARRLQVQERLTQQVAEAIEEQLSPMGVAVVMQAEHLCMSLRGAKTPGALTMTSALRGAFFDKPEARAEVMALLAG